MHLPITAIVRTKTGDTLYAVHDTADVLVARWRIALTEKKDALNRPKSGLISIRTDDGEANVLADSIESIKDYPRF